MNILQDLFEAALKAELSFPKIALALIAQRFKAVGIDLTRLQRAIIKARLEAVQGDDLALALEMGEAQLGRSTLTEEQRAAGNISIDLDPENLLSSLEERIPPIVLACVEKASGLMFKGLKHSAPRMLKHGRRERRGFEARLARKWGRALDLLEMFREIAVEAGADFNMEFRAEAAATTDLVFEVLTRLHARACQVASEVLALLRSGHADGAHARWRTLHEIAVIGLVVKAHGNEVAERYILHDAIESYRATMLYQEHYAKLGDEPLVEEEVVRSQSTYDALKNRFGRSYGEEYGWAATALGNERPSFRSIERAAGLDHLRPYYKLASHNVHANPKGTFFKLGLLREQNVLLSGPSDLGLADPGHGTAISLAQITTALLTTRPNIDRLVICQVLLQLEDAIGEVFLAAHRAVERAHREQVHGETRATRN